MTFVPPDHRLTLGGATAGSDTNGGFTTVLHVLDHDALGPRTVHVAPRAGDVAAAPLLVTGGTLQPGRSELPPRQRGTLLRRR